MAIPEINDAKRMVAAKELDAVEGRLAIKLPSVYREWLLKFNGGRPRPGCFSLNSGKEKTERVAWFLAVYEGEVSNFEMNYKYMKVTTKRVPETLAPIATDPFGNLICLGIRGAELGKGYFWDHETEAEEGQEPTFANVSLVGTFEEFIQMLGEPSDD